MISFPPVSELLPHKGRMVFLDRIVAFDGVRLVAACVPSVHHGPMTESGEVEICCGIEYVSQAFAAFSCLSSKRTTASGPRLGYLVSLRGVELLTEHLSVGADLTVEVVLEERNQDFSSFTGTIRDVGGSCLLTGRFGVFAS